MQIRSLYMHVLIKQRVAKITRFLRCDWTGNGLVSVQVFRGQWAGTVSGTCSL